MTPHDLMKALGLELVDRPSRDSYPTGTPGPAPEFWYWATGKRSPLQFGVQHRKKRPFDQYLTEHLNAAGFERRAAGEWVKSYDPSMGDPVAWAKTVKSEIEGVFGVIPSPSAEKPYPLDFEEAPMPLHPLNLILHGPPGTGKTFVTARTAVEICDGVSPEANEEMRARYRQLTDEGRILFVTFHPSFAYEDFVEGLRPSAIEGGAGFKLDPVDGVVKAIARRASARIERTAAASGFDVSGRQVFKMSLGRANVADDDYLYEECLENGYVLLGYGGDRDLTDPGLAGFDGLLQSWRQMHPEAFGNDPNVQMAFALRDWMRAGDLVIITDGNLAFRAVGEVTGPYHFSRRDDGFHHRRAVRWLWSSDEALPFTALQDKRFSQMSIYNLVSEDGGKTRNKTGLKLDVLERLITGDPKEPAHPDTPHPHVLIIDEINRANIAKTMGELITLLEADKRIGAAYEAKITLPYSKEAFGLPKNLYVLGTMNTADRSIALLDIALRRRFDFREMAPQPELLEIVEGVDLRALLAAMNKRIEWLFDRDHLIGHAWLMDVTNLADLSDRFRQRIIPLLVEYFHEDWEKVRTVLNETGDASGDFIRIERLSPPAGFEGFEPRRRYVVNQDPHPRHAWDRLIG